jgi:hypothetical protein
MHLETAVVEGETSFDSPIYGVHGNKARSCNIGTVYGVTAAIVLGFSC